jgi:hypothetical protein
MINFNKNYNIMYLFYDNLYYIFGFILLLVFINMIYNVTKSFSFYQLGNRLSKSYFNFFDHKFYTNFGLEENDNLDFIINIRTDDASDDCNIKGRFKGNNVEKLSILGDGKGCINLRNNNL